MNQWAIQINSKLHSDDNRFSINIFNGFGQSEKEKDIDCDRDHLIYQENVKSIEKALT